MRTPRLINAVTPLRPVDLRVPTRLTAVELWLEDTQTHGARLYVPGTPDRPLRAEDLLAVLDRDQHFVVVYDEERACDTFLNRNAIAMARISLRHLGTQKEDEVLSFDEDEPLYERLRPVRVELSIGQELEGRLLYSAPPDRSRPSDHLNGPGRFFGLWTESHLVLINKTFAVRVIEKVAETPAGTGARRG